MKLLLISATWIALAGVALAEPGSDPGDGYPKMLKPSAVAKIIKGRNFEAIEPDGDEGILSFGDDMRMKFDGPNRHEIGSYRISETGYCSKWVGKTTKCFTVSQRGKDKYQLWGVNGGLGDELTLTDKVAEEPPPVQPPPPPPKKAKAKPKPAEEPKIISVERFAAPAEEPEPEVMAAPVKGPPPREQFTIPSCQTGDRLVCEPNTKQCDCLTSGNVTYTPSYRPLDAP